MKRLFTIALLFAAGGLHAQQLTPTVVASTGAFATGGGYSLSYTVGEPIVTTVTAGSNILTQGFQQPDDKSIGILELAWDQMQVSLYPNPADETVYLNVTCHNDACRDLRVSLHDLLGRTISVPLAATANGDETRYAFNLKQLSASMYFVRLQNADGSLSRIVKFNKTTL